MSSFDITGVVNNLMGRTNTYTPLIEIIVNAIQAIESKKTAQGCIDVVVVRSKQSELEITDKKPDVSGFRVIDNGVGFDKKNRDSFDELFTKHKIRMGCKGFGRFTALKYYENMSVESVYENEGTYRKRSFYMGKVNDLIEKESDCSVPTQDTGTTVALLESKRPKFTDNSLDEIADSIVEKLLPYFVDEKKGCPRITLSEEGDNSRIVLNDHLKPGSSAKILPIQSQEFSMQDQQSNFSVRIFKIYASKSRKSCISLVGHRREVTSTMAHQFIPEFDEGFNDGDKNYILKAYVFSEYLDNNVSVTRGEFEFSKDSDESNDVLHPYSQKEIEEQAASILRSAAPEIEMRVKIKARCVEEYINRVAPWHKQLLRDIDLSELSYNPSEAQIEEFLQHAKYLMEVELREDIQEALLNVSGEKIKIQASSLVKRISKSSKNDLVHYIAQRRCVLDIMDKSLCWDENERYDTEADVHKLIFPMREDSESISFEDHNLWILDERLNFTSFISSDKPFNKPNGARPDILIYGNPVAFRGENNPSNPVTIFEFKRPGRIDFINPSSKDDPVAQIINYASDLQDGKYKTPEGKVIKVDDKTPIYGYVVCSLEEPKIRDWLVRTKNFSPMPDNEGYFLWQSGLSMYIEVLSWEKVLNDAKMRNSVFFNKLKID